MPCKAPWTTRRFSESFAICSEPGVDVKHLGRCARARSILNKQKPVNQPQPIDGFSKR